MRVVLRNTRNWNGYFLNTLTRTYWRASLVPAAAVIPAPVAYAIVAVAKRLAVVYPNVLLGCTPVLG